MLGRKKKRVISPDIFTRLRLPISVVQERLHTNLSKVTESYHQ